MFKIITQTECSLLAIDDFYVKNVVSGLDELVFHISVEDENYSKITEESILEYEQPYLIKAIDAGAKTAKVKCQLNLDELKQTLNPAYTNESDTLTNTITGVLPDGWYFFDHSMSVIRRTIEGAYTPYDVIVQCMKTYNVVMRFDVKRKRVDAYNLKAFRPMGAFASRELNLKEINYKGKSSDFYTRLYAYGKDGLSFAEINNGKAYVENFEYSSKIICASWKDERYEDAESLLADAQAKVDAASKPEKSYTCSVYDLAAVDPDMYGFQDFSLFSVIRLIDDLKKTAINHQVVEYYNYPYYPEKNIVTLSATAPKISSLTKELQTNISDLKNEVIMKETQMQKQMDIAIKNATDLITGNKGGNVVVSYDTDGNPYEILIMDTKSISTAQKVWRWNAAGWGYSKNGYDGPYELAATLDGGFVADFITAGILNANLIRAGTIQDLLGNNFWNLDTGEFAMSASTKVGDSTVASTQNVADAKDSAYLYTDNAVEEYDKTLVMQEIFNRLTNNGEIQGLFMKDGQLYINAAYILAGVLTDNKGANFWNLETGEFSMSSTAKVGSSTVASTQNVADAKDSAYLYADNAVKELDDALTTQEVFNRLTNNGEIEGLYMKDGKLYVNASYILSGILDATMITVKGLVVGDNVTMGEGATISWKKVTDQPGIPKDTNDLTNGADYQTSAQVTQITENTVTAEFINALKVIAGSVAAENITGTTISGKTISGCKVVTDDANTLYKTIINDGCIDTYGVTNKESKITGRLSCTKLNNSEDWNGLALVARNKYMVLGAGNTDSPSFSGRYYINNGGNPEGYEETNIWFGTERHKGVSNFDASINSNVGKGYTGFKTDGNMYCDKIYATHPSLGGYYRPAFVDGNGHDILLKWADDSKLAVFVDTTFVGYVSLSTA